MLAEIFLVRLEALMRYRAQEQKPPTRDPGFVPFKASKPR
jgi:hypothetical protein